MQPKGPWAELTIPPWFRTRQGRVSTTMGSVLCWVAQVPQERRSEHLHPTVAGVHMLHWGHWDLRAPPQIRESQGLSCLLHSPHPGSGSFSSPSDVTFPSGLEPVSRALLLLTTWGFWLWVFSPHPCQCGHLKSCEDEMTCAFVKYLAQRGSRDDSKLLSSTFEACLLIFPKSHYSGSYDWKQTENSLQEVIQIFL